MRLPLFVVTPPFRYTPPADRITDERHAAISQRRSSPADRSRHTANLRFTAILTPRHPRESGDPSGTRLAAGFPPARE